MQFFDDLNVQGSTDCRRLQQPRLCQNIRHRDGLRRFGVQAELTPAGKRVVADWLLQEQKSVRAKGLRFGQRRR